MDKLIDVVNKLQGVFSTTNIGDLNTEIQLPQIVVIGHSSGKSSVLESIVGRDFLPRGTGIVTRRPLILHLNNCAPDDPLRSKYSKWKGIFKTVGPETDFAFFEHKPNQVFVRFNEVYEEIETDTDRVAGTNRGICPKPIILSIYSHKVVQLSLVDLPGITKVPVGDQPRDIEKQIHQMIMKYIVNPNAIILAVSAANVDFATSEAIKLAQEVDPQGERTLAVLTKLDLMDKGTNAMNVLTGNVIPIKRGIVGVVNRSQEDIDNKKEIEACWEYEKQFLQQKYPSISHQNGIKYLAGILHKMLMEHIQACLPELKARINEYIKKCTKEMEQLGDANIDPHAKLLDLNNRFVRAYNQTIMGVGDGMDMIKEFTMDDDLFGGAKISWIFHTEYGQDLDAINLANELKTEYIHRAVLQTGGLHPSIIVPEKCFEALSSHQIKRLEEPSLNCVDRVHEEMKKAIGYCGKEDLIHELKRFPAFAEKIYNFMIHLLDERAKETKKSIQQLVESHVAFINTKHPDFSSERALLIMLMKLEPNVQQVAQYHASREMNSIGAKLVNEMKETDGEIEEIYAGEIAKKMSKRDWQNCILIRRLVKAYFKIVRKAVQDQTPKQIYSELIHHVKEKLFKGSLMQIFKDSDINKLFMEDEEVSQRRFETENRLETLQKAAEVLDALSIYYTF